MATQFDGFGEISSDRSIKRLVHLIEFVSDFAEGCVGYVSPDFFFWNEPPERITDEHYEGKSIQRELRLLGNALVCDKFNRLNGGGHVVRLTLRESRVVEADFSMVESLDLDGHRELYGQPFKKIRSEFGSITISPVNIASLCGD